MRWVRSNIRLGSWCALLALAIQFLLAFGHVHRAEFAWASDFSPLSVVGVRTGLATGLGASSASAKPTGIASDYCAICAVMALANSVRQAAAPALPMPAVAARVRFAANTEIISVAFSRLLFRARAPPSA